MKMVLATFFLLIFSFQVIPVKEIGKILFKGTMVEEIHETAPDSDETSSKVKKGKEPFTPQSYIHAETSLVLRGSGLGILSPESISKQHIPDIITPPPNVA
ncbi:MAG: hypothetical protein K8F30_04885 [Taibaiella sp.]|nr:hypothetical protein [Taibaiella sp.]